MKNRHSKKFLTDQQVLEIVLPKLTYKAYATIFGSNYANKVVQDGYNKYGRMLYAMPCPIHKGEKKNFKFDLEKGLYSCFSGCGGEGGNLLMAIKEALEVDTATAQALILKAAGINSDISIDYKVDTSKEEFISLFEGREEPETPENQAKINAKYSLECSKHSHPYIDTRGYTKQIINDFLIGYDKTKRRMIIPIQDIEGNIIAYSERYPDKELPEGVIKYKHSKGFNKDYMYGLSQSLDKIKEKKYLVLTEGFFDAIRLYTYHEPSAAVLGSHITDGQIDTLLDLHFEYGLDTLYIALDNDIAGRIGKWKAVKDLFKYFTIYIVNLSDKDPDETSRLVWGAKKHEALLVTYEHFQKADAIISKLRKEQKNLLKEKG